MAGELAWLIKDNLPCKHLILSAEETFISFLETSIGSEDILELEPMVSYHRMLLHRLADIFGLMHESVGEGDYRHLILERCQDSSIPPILVSDILKWQYGETQSPQATCQLLKRKMTLQDLQHKERTDQLPSISFEEREAAYLAARERIFSLSSSEEIDEPKEQLVPRPRTVPVVAQRMIAHALGKRIMVDSSSEKPDVVKNTEFQCADENMTDKYLNPASSQIQRVAPQPVKDSGTGEQTLATATKRMMAKYLNIDALCTDRKSKDKMLDTKVPYMDAKMERKNLGETSQDVGTVPQTAKVRLGHLPSTAVKRTMNRNLKSKILSMDDKMTDKDANTRIPFIDEKMTEKSLIDSSQVTEVALQPAKTTFEYKPAAAAKRMFAQALGLPVANCPKGASELTARLASGSNNAADAESFLVGIPSNKNACHVSDSVEVVQERSTSLTSNLRPEENDSGAEVEQPSINKALSVHPQNLSSMTRMPNAHIPRRAAQRLFAQALGIQTVSSSRIEGNLTRNSSFASSLSSSSKGLRQGHKTGSASDSEDSKDSNVVNNVVISSTDMTISANNKSRVYDTEISSHLSHPYDENGKPDSDSCETCRNIAPQRHISGASQKQMGEERLCTRFVTFKEKKSSLVNLGNTTINSGRTKLVNNSEPAKMENSSRKLTRTSADESSIIHL